MAPTIETPRLILRPWRDDDVEPWAEMSADERVMEFFSAPYTHEQAVAVAARLRQALERDGYGFWVLECKGGPSFAGVIEVKQVAFEAHFTPALEVGWRLRYDLWNRGYATEGARAALDFAFTELESREIVALTAALNRRSRRVMERLGMSYDPRDDFENPHIEPGHPLRPHVLYRLRRSDFGLTD
jgi:RimJ/RimL family protein N-acetyltransferase